MHKRPILQNKFFGICTFLFLFFSSGLYAQATHNNIEVHLANNFIHRYAYLYDWRVGKLFRAEKVNNVFSFQIERKEPFHTMSLWLVTDTAANYAALTGLQKDADFTRIIAVEDVKITVYSSLKDVKISGGKYNLEIARMNETIVSEAYEGFFKDLGGSPVAMLFLRSLVKYNELPGNDNRFNVKLFYSMLSEELKKSEDGLLIKKEIDRN